MERLQCYIAKRTTKTGERRWRAAWTDPETGREHARHFTRKIDAQQHLDRLRGELQESGGILDVARGRERFDAFARRWAAAQAHRPATEELVERQLRLHVLPYLGHRTLASIRPSEIQAWAKARSTEMAPSTLQVVYRWVSSIFRAAVDDGIIRQSPCGRKVKLPRGGADAARVVPLDTSQVHAIMSAVPADVRALVMLGAGAGLRQGEAFGLTADRIDFLRREVRVDRQLAGADGTVPIFGLPKTDSSVRTVPLPQVVVDELARHVEALGGELTGQTLLFRDGAGRPWARNRWGEQWRRAIDSSGIAAGVGFHDLRHYYAALLIRRGSSVKTVQNRLGHRSAVTTLDTYGHLWPDAEDETRRAVDDELRAPQSVVGAAGESHSGG